MIAEGASVAVKVHMGELGNLTYLRPVFVRKVVDMVKTAGGNPFVTDTTTLYQNKRFTARNYLETAAYNGFSPETLGAPVVIADGEEGYSGFKVKVERTVNGCGLKEMEVASEFSKAETVIVLSHVKGHNLSGLGGALKNVAMGCVTKKGKAAQHSVHIPQLDESRCDGCGACVKVCVFNALRLEGGKPVRDLGKCMACSLCLFECPKKAYHWPEGSKEVFQTYLAHSAYAVLSTFKEGKVGFLNFVQDVTPLCDCCTPAGQVVVGDVGILASKDPVAIDKASLDLIDKSPPIGRLTVTPPDFLGKINETSSLIHLEVAQKLGLGSLIYQLISI